jgi:ATP-dependent helicase HrpB
MSDTTPLPIDALLNEIVTLSRNHACLVIEAPPGAGKTTRVPAALAQAAHWRGAIWVAEPRRLATKLVAHRVATEMGSKLGDGVGYTVRFDDCSKPTTKIRFVTSGILLRRLLNDSRLTGVDCVIMDEFHERHLETDLALALALRAQALRPELRIIVMSATLDAARIAKLLGNCPRVRAEGRTFPLDIEFQAAPDDRPLEKRVASAVRQIYAANPSANTLVFLPGASEIRRVEQTIEPLCRQAELELTVLHGDLSLDAQTRAVNLGTRPRVVLSTNIAESSITVAGITAVIDSGLCRQVDHSSFSGLSRLTIQKISQASATQRAGRAGRTARGRVIRLFTKGDFESRPEFDTPDILRTDFAEACLMLMAASESGSAATDAARPTPIAKAASSTLPGQQLFKQYPLLDRPSDVAVDAALLLLRQLGALDDRNEITASGRKLASLPMHPRLGRLLMECEQRDIAAVGALVVALLSEREIRFADRANFTRGSAAHSGVTYADSDLLELVELYLEGRRATTAYELKQLGLDVGAFHAVRRAHEQLERLVKRQSRQTGDIDADAEHALALAVLFAFPDRVAKRRSADSRELILRSGTALRLAESSVVAKATWLVAVDVEQRQVADRNTVATVRLASAIHPDWLLEHLTDEIVDQTECVWCDPPGRVEKISRMRLGSLTIEESRCPAQPSAEASAVLVSVVKERQWLRSEALESLFVRLSLVSQLLPAEDRIEDSPEQRERLLRDVLDGRTDLSGLDADTLCGVLISQLPQRVTSRLRTDVPDSVTLPGGRHCRIHYEPGRSPWIASRLQDFFGLVDSPTILGGKKKLVLRLLAPNQREVQITDDLGQFWLKHYPTVRSELMRRYPRHAWPEDGRTAIPPQNRPGRHG